MGLAAYALRTRTACSLSALAWFDVPHSHNREASKVTVNSSHFHPAHQHYTDEAHKAETVPSVVIYRSVAFWSYCERSTG